MTDPTRPQAYEEYVEAVAELLREDYFASLPDSRHPADKERRPRLRPTGKVRGVWPGKADKLLTAIDLPALLETNREQGEELERVTEALTEDREKWSFNTLMFMGDAILKAWYPDDVFPDDPLEPAHLCARAHGGCDDDLCVIPLCHWCHRRLDQPDAGKELDVLSHLLATPGRYTEEIQHALGPGHYNGDLLSLLRRLTGERYVPESMVRVEKS